MRFTNPALLGAAALPLLALAEHQESPINGLKAQGLLYWDKIQSYFPSKPAPIIEVLAIDTWKNILNSSPATSTKSEDAVKEDWFLLLTGGNKTCYGLCEGVERSFNESAELFAAESTHPNLAILNCDQQPILCNSWAAGPPALYVFEIPSLSMVDAKTPLYVHALNTTTTTPETYVELWKTGAYKEKGAYEGYFHPVDGQLAKLGLDVPMGYVLYAFSMVPSWVFMIGVSFISRTMMSRRMAPAPRAAAPAGGAPPGDAR